MFKIGQKVICVEAVVTGTDKPHPNTNIGSVYQIKQITRTNRLYLHGLRWSLSPKRFKPVSDDLG